MDIHLDIVTFGLTALCVVFILVALAIPVSNAVGLPLPVLIAGGGLIYGVFATTGGSEAIGSLLTDYDRWMFGALGLNNQTLLLVFLPPLLFEMALHVNVRRLIEDSIVVVVMAVVAVILATICVGLSLWLTSSIGLIACLLLGAAVSTTDPAAVITIFREIGAPRRLLVILEGESLLNDAAAIAVFTLLAAALVTGEAISPPSFVFGFLYSFAVGAACGVGLGWLGGRIYPALGGSAIAEITVTVALAYGTYLISEFALQASGVVGVVFAGLSTTVFGTLSMGPRNWRTLARVWAQIGFWANTLILLLAATKAPQMLLSLDWQDCVLLVVIYLAAMLGRACILFGLLPGLNRLGISTPITRPQKILALWGGVRGAVTLVLALSLAELPGLAEGEGDVIAALGAGYVFMTLLFNASTLATAMRRLGLNRLSAGDAALREKIVAGTREEARSYVTGLAKERAIDPAAVEQMRAEYEPQIRQATQTSSGISIPFGERLRLGLTILSSQELQLVAAAFEEGVVGPRSTRVLRSNAERLADAARIRGREGYEALAQASLGFPMLFLAAVWLHRLRLSDRPLRLFLERRLSVFLESESIVRDLEIFVSKVIGPMIGDDAAENLRQLVEVRLEALQDEIDVFRLQYPEYTRQMEAILLMRAGIRRERAQYDRLFNEGVIGGDLHRLLDRELDQRMRSLSRPPPVDLGLTSPELIRNVPLFGTLDEKRSIAIRRMLKGRLLHAGETVVAKNERGHSMYFVASGVLEVKGLGKEVLLSNGDFFGELSLLAPTRRRSTEIVARSFCRVLMLSRRDFRRLAKHDPELEKIIRAAAARQLGEGFGYARSRSDGTTADAIA